MRYWLLVLEEKRGLRQWPGMCPSTAVDGPDRGSARWGEMRGAGVQGQQSAETESRPRGRRGRKREHARESESESKHRIECESGSENERAGARVTR